MPTPPLSDLTQALLAAATRAGAEAADALAVSGASLTVDIRRRRAGTGRTRRGHRDRIAGADRAAAGLRLGL
jgi:hypothetical protein